MTSKEIRALTLTEVSKLIHSKELSPVDLTEAYLSRIDATESTINSFTAVYKDTAREVAHAMEIMQKADHFIGPLHGIPIALKDNIEMKGLLTTASSHAWEDHIPTEDAPVVKKLKSAGAIVIGKTNMHEFAWGATTDTPKFGASRNPWNPERFCCGSSGGSAGSVANATSAAALGTDTGGSVRLPSSVCGLVGMRPTIGRVSIQGIAPLCYNMDTCGPLARNVSDSAAMLNVMAGYVNGDPSASTEVVPDFASQIGKSAKHMRVGILPDYLFKCDQPDVIKAVKDAIDTFKSLGAEIVECKIDHLNLMVKAWYAVCAPEASAFHQKNLRECPEKYGEDVRMLLTAGEFRSGVSYVQAQRYRRWLRQQFQSCFEDVDFFVFPTLPTTAVPVGKYDVEINGKVENMLDLSCTYVCFAPATGLPAITIPCGRDHDGMPIGMMLLGDAYQEQKLYRAAAAFEKVYSLYRELPGAVEE